MNSEFHRHFRHAMLAAIIAAVGACLTACTNSGDTQQQDSPTPVTDGPAWMAKTPSQPGTMLFGVAQANFSGEMGKAGATDQADNAARRHLVERLMQPLRSEIIALISTEQSRERPELLERVTTQMLEAVSEFCVKRGLVIRRAYSRQSGTNLETVYVLVKLPFLELSRMIHTALAEAIRDSGAAFRFPAEVAPLEIANALKRAQIRAWGETPVEVPARNADFAEIVVAPAK